MDNPLLSPSLNDAPLRSAIDALVEAVRAGGSGAGETTAILTLMAQLREANQHLVLAAVRAQVLQEEAETRNRQQNEFLAMLAHELRNPLAPISNAASLLEKLTSAHPLLPRIHGVINRQISHMAHLIDDLLDASRITSGKVKLSRKPIAVSDVLERSLEIIRPLVDQRQQHLVLPLGAATMLIEGDLVRLSQALSNILANACKFTPDGGTITLEVTHQATTVLITVRDNGVGIDTDLLPHIFDLFRQGPRSLARSEGGLGIGLSVAKGLVEMHGGRITVHSAGTNLGSEFSIFLPVLASEAAPAEELSHAKQSLPVQCCQILLIEDNEDALATLQLLLELDGHQVHTAVDGVSALKLASCNTYQVIVCDIGLPGLNGYELIRQIRQQLASVDVYAIAISGYSQPDDRERALMAGFNHYLVKPVHHPTLLSMIAARSLTYGGISAITNP
ncbi:Signal transduction histidine kinase [Noviherbaspirillum humi]|uniref:histidine kinase n=1 Tax=Noviherbaspirillum humi TaxID=1688639 RepID=A0A239IIU6_9BURK|nr:hybrid sensor histidine kinase/response regulator [Noviherbaspirillum humi]SNS93547.1 Signal transduction histidine kinase [Noviherbaspirillum humi]